MYSELPHSPPTSGRARESGVHAASPRAPVPAPALLVGERYRLVERLGTGGMGSVWLARDTTLDRDCAVKVLEGKYLMHPELVARFEHEAKVTAAVRTPHVVEVFDYGVWRGLPFMVLEYLPGENLARRLRRLGRLDLAGTYRIVAHVARALARVHAAGIVHRDLKPANVLLSMTDEGEIARLIDFGVADDVRFEDGPAGMVIGTPAYMSPEQARGQSVDWRSDLWSLGVLAFECLTGEMLFDGNSSANAANKVLYRTLPSPRDLVPELPQALDGWFQRALSRDREERFQSAKELADALARAIGESTPLTISKQPPRPAERVPVTHPSADSSAETATASPSREPSRCRTTRLSGLRGHRRRGLGCVARAHGDHRLLARALRAARAIAPREPR